MKHVLFVCHQNAGRSQMAEAFFNRFAPVDVQAESGGTDPAPAVWPAVIEVMAERGFDLRTVVPKELTVDMQLRADWAVAIGCGDSCPLVPTHVNEWDIPDPAGRSLDDVRHVCDLVEQHVRMLVTAQLETIRGDRTLHEQWLRQLLPSLNREFDDIHHPMAIRATADEVLEHFDNVRVRSFVVALAQREARDRLRRPTEIALA
jgi:arsenate reductase